MKSRLDTAPIDTHEVSAITTESEQLLIKLSEQTDQMAYLDQDRVYKVKELSKIESFLSAMDPEDILSRFQPEVLVWIAANAPLMDDSYRFRQSLESLFGFDGDLFERARLWQWQKHYNSFGGQVLNHYQVFSSLHDGVLNDVPLDELIGKTTKNEVEISQSRIQDYGLSPLRIHRKQNADKFSISSVNGREETWGYLINGDFYGIYLDTPSGFALTYKDKPQAVVAIAADGTDGIAIHQMQGVKGKKLDPNNPYSKTDLGKISARGLAVLDWQKLMVAVTASIAQKLDKTHITIITGDKNTWTKAQLSEEEPHLTKEQAHAAYDRQAQRLGFTQREDSNWQHAIAH